MKTANQRALEAVQQKRAEISQSSTAILEEQSEEDDRQLTEEETKQLAQYVKDMKTLDQQEADYTEAVRVEQEVLQYGREIGVREGVEVKSINDVQVTGDNRSFGQIFVESEQFKSIQSQGGHFSTGPIELSTKGTLLAGTMSPGSGSGGGLLPVPGVIPGVVEKLFQRVTVENLLGSVQVTGNSQRYVVEGTATSGATGVAEGGAKPESTLGLGTTDEPIKKVATTLVISDEMLEDAPAVSDYINGRLRLFVDIETERQLVSGAGTNDLVGLTGRAINTYAAGTVDNNAIAIFKALNGTRGSAFLEPDAIVMNPANWQTTRLLVDSNGQLFGGGPFTGAYGNNGIHGNIESGQLAPPSDSIWNKPVIVTTAIGVGTALLGSFAAAAAVLQRTGLSVELTNAHSDYFTKNLVAIRAERRLGLACYRPSAFTKITGLS